MEKNKELYGGYGHEPGGLPWKNIISFVLCIILASFTLWGALYSDYTFKTLLFVISVIAFLQALLQLFYVQARQ
ncbi:hypothetical protein [Halobacillus amylolyticus]|uniref:Uncharacterized protein n=1 Tax=Halobacillus amylolyticus TaxID=2932259 RepID=A0ABY4H7T0_9BACI|nr:hypothetical protein [Halobacillus amylolyticus]UOR10931.1 hypothetical protein MUO15_15135 [Halobacillus amylolyticus]